MFSGQRVCFSDAQQGFHIGMTSQRNTVFAFACRHDPTRYSHLHAAMATTGLDMIDRDIENPTFEAVVTRLGKPGYHGTMLSALWILSPNPRLLSSTLPGKPGPRDMSSCRCCRKSCRYTERWVNNGWWVEGWLRVLPPTMGSGNNPELCRTTLQGGLTMAGWRGGWKAAAT